MITNAYFIWAGVCVLGCAMALLGEAKERGSLTALGKLIAACAYILAAVALGALESPYGRTVVLAMSFCWVGDMLLVSNRSRRLFLGGLAAFLVGHLVYIIAFWLRGQSFGILFAALMGMALFAVLIMRWLTPHLDKRMRIPVLAYVVAISVMLAMAIGSWAGQGGWSLPAGAGLFVVSDISVARNRFVSPGWVNRAWGLPTYFLAQLLLAWSVVV